MSVIHFDAHLDTWPGYPGSNSPQSRITHGTFFNVAHEEGLMRANASIHAGIRCKLAVRPFSFSLLSILFESTGRGLNARLQGTIDLEHDQETGFELISTDDIDDLGIPEIIKRIRARVGDSPVYLSFDIDVIGTLSSLFLSMPRIADI